MDSGGSSSSSGGLSSSGLCADDFGLQFASWSALALVGLAIIGLFLYAWSRQFGKYKNRGETPFAHPVWNRLRDAIANGESPEVIAELKERCWASIACFHAREHVCWRSNVIQGVVTAIFIALISVPLRGGAFDQSTLGIGLATFAFVFFGRLFFGTWDQYHGADYDTCRFADEVMQDGWAYALVRTRRVDIDDVLLDAAGDVE